MKNRHNGKWHSLTWRISSAVVMVVFIVALTGCGSSSNDSASDMKMSSSNSATFTDQYGAASDMATSTAESKSVVSEVAPQAAFKADNAGDSNSSSPLGSSSTDFSSYDRKLIYNANVALEVDDYAVAQTKLFNMVSLAGGYMLNFNDMKSEYETGGVFVVKVPSQGFNPFVTKLEELKKKDTKLERNIQGKDVTEEYVDIESRLKAKQVVEARLLDFMEKAKDTKNLLEFSNQLAQVQVQEEIETIKGRMRYIDQNVAFSTVEIRMYEMNEKAPKPVEKDDNVLTRAGDAMTSSGKAMLAMFEGIFIIIAGAIPILIVIILIAIVVIFIYRKTRYATGGPHTREAYTTPVTKEKETEPQEQQDEEQEKK